MSTLNRALNSLRMVKFAKKAPFYWYSFLDPEADAYEAVNQELLDKEEELGRTDTTATRTGDFNINGHTISRSDATTAFANARARNNALAEARRAAVFRPWLTGMGIGAVAGGATFGGLGYWGAGKLGYKDRGKRNAALIGAAAGALLGGAVGANAGANWHLNQPGFGPDNGTSVLKGLNNELNSHLGLTDTDTTPEFIDTSVANTARDRALGS